MPDNDDLDFKSLFNEESEDSSSTDTKKSTTTFDKIDIYEGEPFKDDQPEELKYKAHEDTTVKKKRTSEDFEPDMDAILITAQAPMIVEGMKYITMKDFTSKRLTVYTEAFKGVDLIITIIQRNPKKFFKLVDILKNDIDFREVEKTAFNLYNLKFKAVPVIEDHIQRAYELLKERIRVGYEKALISKAAVAIKKYFLLSGGLNTDILREYIRTNEPSFKTEMANLNQRVNSAIKILKSNSPEIAKGLKGRDVNIFIIKATELLINYYHTTGNSEAAEFHRRLHNNHKKYHVVRE